MKQVKIYSYRFKLTHDKGKLFMSTVAGSMNKAKEVIMKAENCPECAIVPISRKLQVQYTPTYS